MKKKEEKNEGKKLYKSPTELLKEVFPDYFRESLDEERREDAEKRHPEDIGVEIAKKALGIE